MTAGRETLEELRQKFEEAQRVAHVGYWEREVGSDRITWSDESYRIFGLTLGDTITPAKMLERIHPDDRALWSKTVTEALRCDIRYELEYRVIRPDGEVRFVHSQGDLKRDASGRPSSMFGTMQDITSRRRAEEALRASEERFRMLVQFSFDVYWETDAEHRFILQQYAEGLADMPAPAAEIGKTRWEVPYLEPDEDAWRKHRDTLDAHLPFRDFEVARPTANGGKRWVSTSGLPMFDHTGRFIGYRGVGRRITERKRVEEERRAQLRFFENMDRVNRAMQGANDLEQMMSDVLAAVLSTFQCDRAWLVYPCDPEAASFRVVMEHTRPEFPGALRAGTVASFAMGGELPMDAEIARICQMALASGDIIKQRLGSEDPPAKEMAERFSVQSIIGMALFPKGHKPYLFGLHQCSYPRVWTSHEEQLFREISRRLGDALTSVLIFQDLRESRAKLQQAQHIASIGYWERDVDTDLSVWSDETYQIFGEPRDEAPISAARINDLIHPDDRERFCREFGEALQGARRYDIEYRVVRRDGEVRAVHSQGDVTQDESGKPRRVFGVLQDITERKRADDALRESERRYRNIFETAGVSIWEADFSQVKAAIDQLEAEGVRDFRRYLTEHPEFVREAVSMITVLDVNTATVELFGAQSKAELLSSPLHDIFTPETLDAFVTGLLAVAEERPLFAAEAKFQTLQGKELAVLFTIAFPPPPAKMNRVLVTITDITERKRAEYLTEQVFQSSPDGISVVGSDYRYQRVNPIYERNWGMPAKAIVGKHIADLLGTETFEETIKPNLDKCFKGEEISYAESFVNSLGRRHLMVTYSPLRPNSERVEAALVITRDLTDHMLASEALREAQAQLAHVNRIATMGQLTASIAHEVNQPITAVVINAHAALRWLSAQPADLEEARNALGRIVDSGQRAGDVIGRIRALTKKAPSQQKGPFDLNEAVLDVIALIRSEVIKNGVSLETQLAAGLPPIHGDRVQLQQVILNLIINAVEAMAGVDKGARQLQIITEANPESLLVTVRDLGPGLDPTNVDRIFEAFYTTKSDGMGMGLAICRSIVEAHEGRLWATANTPQGAVFQFTLPSAEIAS